MNKKFFTLLVAMIATISFGAFAQSDVDLEEGYPEAFKPDSSYVLEAWAVPLTPSNDALLQERNAIDFTGLMDAPIGYLVSEEVVKGQSKIKLVTGTFAPKSFAALDSALWDIAIERPAGQEVAYYSFQNVASSKFLAYNMPDAKNIVTGNTLAGTDNPVFGAETYSKLWINGQNASVPVATHYYMSLSNVAGNDSVFALAYNADRTAVYPAKFGNTLALEASEARVIIIPRKVATAKFAKKITNGVYAVTITGSANSPELIGKDLRMNMAGRAINYFTAKDLRNAQHMPSAQWVFTNNSVEGTQVTAVNREYPGNNGRIFNNDYVYELQDATVNGTCYTASGDTILLTPITNISDPKQGYWYHGVKDADSTKVTATLRYLNLLKNDQAIVLDANDAMTISKDESATTFHLLGCDFTYANAPYGYVPQTTTTAADYIANLVQLERSYYFIAMKTPSLTYNGPATWRVITYNSTFKVFELSDEIIEIKDDANNTYQPDYAAIRNAGGIRFHLKENNEYANEGDEAASCYYSLVYQLGNDTHKININPSTLELVTGEVGDSRPQVSTAAFKVAPGIAEHQNGYRLFGTEDDEKDVPSIVKIFRANYDATRAYLYEDANSVYATQPLGPNEVQVPGVKRESQINFLGVDEERNFDKTKAALKLSYIRGTEMPQYVISVDEDHIQKDGSEEKWELCSECGEKDCGHSKYTPGEEAVDKRVIRVLMNMVETAKYSDDAETAKKYVWDNSYYRLAFVDAEVVWNSDKAEEGEEYRTIDSLIIDGKLFDFENFKMEEGATEFTSHKLYSPVLFSFRLLDTNSNDFLIESESLAEAAIVEFGGRIYPRGDYGGWIKYQNGVPVIVNYYTASWYGYAWDMAEVFNWEVTDQEATSNEGPAAGIVEVTAAYGTITVTGAAGQAVVITDILGKVIANTVITSDAATFAAPAGVAVVKVAGEAAKVLVK
ncbi:hypothetical protein M2137_000137 [Parabacteroides sp. PFB2-10]|uniref:DUF6383 domain-containing protein n=1 Tax=Parabacteroides sp. PFB2-10 TaxID=1742405 RepID=UPI0024765BD8|nr:DUF6383 domain-containing protein [Parabacteroides sp. PFB2-10]MDH6311387.1 hypothetical protein [Parabacteroides sp. PFB2-10]